MRYKTTKSILLNSACFMLAAAAFGGTAIAQESSGDEEGARVLNTITVNARKTEESLQDVPDAVTVFTAETIEEAGIDDVEDFINLTPNVIIRETFRAGVTFITIRGITTGQQGWAPVTYNVDGVQAGSLDAINQGALTDIEQIEVLKGPQGALYGAGAIAGAINVTTKAPTNEFEFGGKASYGNGNDVKLQGAIGGALVEDKVFARGSIYYRDTDGLIESQEGADLDFEEQLSFNGRVIAHLTDTFKVDLRAKTSDITAGAAFQDTVPDATFLDNFDAPFDRPSRGDTLGSEDRNITEYSAKFDWDLPFGTITSVSGYSEIDQDFFQSASFTAPPLLGAPDEVSFCGPIRGANAQPGELVDCIAALTDDFETFTQDIRLASNGDGPVSWLVGASYLDRTAVNRLAVGAFIAPNPTTEVFFLDRFDERTDEWWGLYGQVIWDFADDWQLTVAGRYDDTEYATTQFSDASLSTIVPALDENGNPTNSLDFSDSKFQPKVQLSYDINDNVMIYGTYAEGYRAGFFNTGNLTAPEETENFEVGIKSTLNDGTLILNAAAFQIDYSDQQFTSVVATPPFRVTSNIPESEITGVEIDGTAFINDYWTLSGAIGWLDAEVADGSPTPATPEWTANVSSSLNIPINSEWDFTNRIDYRYQGEMFLGTNSAFPIDGKNFLNLRAGVQNDNWSVTGFWNNALDERQANDATNIGVVIRSINKPESYGVELAYRY